MKEYYKSYFDLGESYISGNLVAETSEYFELENARKYREGSPEEIAIKSENNKVKILRTSIIYYFR